MRRAGGILALLLPAAATAAGEAAGRHGGIPWGEILKQAVNFAILAGVLVYFLRKPLAGYLKERSELLRKVIDDAARSRTEAAGKLAEIEARLSRLSGEVDEMSRKMGAEAEEEAGKIRDAAAAEIARIGEQARFLADQEVKKARAELRAEAADLSTKASEEMVRKALTPADQERMVRENIEKIREILR